MMFCEISIADQKPVLLSGSGAEPLYWEFPIPRRSRASMIKMVYVSKGLVWLNAVVGPGPHAQDIYPVAVKMLILPLCVKKTSSYG